MEGGLCCQSVLCYCTVRSEHTKYPSASPVGGQVGVWLQVDSANLASDFPGGSVKPDIVLTGTQNSNVARCWEVNDGAIIFIHGGRL